MLFARSGRRWRISVGEDQVLLFRLSVCSVGGGREAWEEAGGTQAEMRRWYGFRADAVQRRKLEWRAQPRNWGITPVD